MAEESILYLAIDSLQKLGFFDIMLPFLLIFSIVYGILEKSQIFGENRHDINAVIAFVIGLMVVVTSSVLNLLTGFLPWVGLMVVIFLSFMILTVMFCGEAKGLWENPAIKYGGAIVVTVFLAFYWLNTLGLFSVFAPDEGFAFFTVGDMAALAAIVIFFVVIVAVVKGGGKD
jgi:hypothetical protein